MSDGILFSEGTRIEKGFSVKGSYRAAPDQDPWGWRTDFEIIDKDHITITAYNITPDGGSDVVPQPVVERSGRYRRVGRQARLEIDVLRPKGHSGRDRESQDQHA